MLQSPLKRLKKAKGLKGLRGLGPEEKLPPIPDLLDDPQRVAGLVDDELSRLSDVLGDPQLAKRVIKMQKEEYPNGTYPELVTLDWLRRRNIPHDYQVAVLGGRILKGGQVLDVVVDLGYAVMIWEVNGDYFHTRGNKEQLDATQKMALMGIKIMGKRVQSIVEIWESRLVDKSKRNSTLQMAMSGIELGRA